MSRATSFGFLGSLVLAYTAVVPSELFADTRMSAEGGAFVTEYGTLSQVGFRVISGKPSHVGFDMGVAVLPQAFQFGAMVALFDLDGNVTVPVGSLLAFTPRAGFSAIGLAGDGIAGAAPGYNVGLGAQLRTGKSTALRVDYTRRFFLGAEATDSYDSMTAGFSCTLPQQPRDPNAPRDYPGRGWLEKKK